MLVLVFALTGCRQTDFLKDIVFAAWADIVDDSAPTLVNNPDAQQTDEHLPAFDLDDVSSTADEYQNIVVYSSNPNTVVVTTRHSVFDLSPRFVGVESSDAVRLTYGGSDDDLDHEVDTEFSDIVDAESETDGDSDEASEEERELQSAQDSRRTEGDDEQDDASDAGGSSSGKTGSGGGSNGSGRSGGKSKSGSGEGSSASTGGDDSADSEGAGGSNGDDNGTGDGGTQGDGGDGNGADDGRSARESGGYDGSDITYDPGNQLEMPEKSAHVAAIGQAAVVAQAVGGQGALAAMDAYTYYGYGEEGEDDTFASCFMSVFSDELPEDFAETSLLWDESGTVPGDLKSIEKLVTACADPETDKGGTIVFCSNQGSQADFFSSKQLKSFQAAGIQLVPIDLSTPQGIIDAFVCLGEVLDGSEELADPAAPARNAEQFRELFNNILDAATKSRSRSSDDGTVAVDSEGSHNLYGDYLERDFGTRYTDVWATVADGFEPQANYRGALGLNASSGLLFSTSDVAAGNSPLSMFMQASGVVHVKAARGGEDAAWTTTLLSPLNKSLSKSDFTGYSASGPLSQMSTVGLMEAGHRWSSSDSVYTGSDSVGSSLMPYLIVCDSPQGSGQDVKRAIVSQQDSPTSIYYLEEAGGSRERQSDILSVTLTANDGSTVELHSALGCQHDYEKSIFRDKGVSLEDCIRVNPRGLLGSWTKGTPEAVLEAAWLVDLYSKYPANSDYGQYVVNNAEKFRVTIGDTECADVQQAVEAFYRSVYRCSLADLGLSYSAVVPDSGEGLNSGGA